MFVHRFTSIPIISSAVESAKAFYDFSKTKYQVIDQLENSVMSKVVPQFQPIITGLSAYDAQLVQIDNYACSGLDLLEDSLPIIKEPTEKVQERIFAPVRAVTQSINKSIEDGKHLLVDASHAFDERLKTNVYVNEALKFSENTVDKLFGTAETLSSGESETEATPIVRVQHIGHKVTKQVADRFQTIQKAQLPTPAKLRELAVSIDILKYTNQRLEQQLAWLRQTIAKSQESIVPAQKHVSTSLTQTANALIATLTTTSTQLTSLLPEGVRTKTAQLQAHLKERLQNLQQLRSTDNNFLQQLIEVAETGQKYLETVRLQLVQFYNTNVASYLRLQKFHLPTSSNTTPSNTPTSTNEEFKEEQPTIPMDTLESECITSPTDEHDGGDTQDEEEDEGEKEKTNSE